MTANAPVLIGFDGRADAAVAIRRAGQLLAPRHALVACVWQSFSSLVLHTDIERLAGTMREAADEFDVGAERRARAVAEEGVEIATDAGFEAEALTPRGKKVWQELRRLADEHDVAALVLGCEGIGSLKGALIGSVAAGALHHSSRPLLLVPPGNEHPGEAAGPLVVAYDGSEHARHAIEAAGNLMPGREAIVQNVWTSYAAVASATRIGIPTAVSVAGVESIDKELRERAHQTAEEGAQLARDAGLDAGAEPVEANVNVCHTLLKTARDGDAAAIVAGSRGRSVIGDIVLGSISAGLVHHSPVPVLIAPLRD